MKIICIGRNYGAHAKELQNAVPDEPIVFMKPPTALLINNKPLYYPSFTNDLHYEVEVIIKIGKNGRHIEPQFASDYIEEIGLGIDFTARDIQAKQKAKGLPWEIAKAFDHSAVLGYVWQSAWMCSLQYRVDGGQTISPLCIHNGDTLTHDR